MSDAPREVAEFIRRACHYHNGPSDINSCCSAPMGEKMCQVLVREIIESTLTLCTASEAAMVEALNEVMAMDPFDKVGAIQGEVRAALSASSDRAKQMVAIVEAARELKFGAYPAHGSGFVSIVTAGNIDKFNAALAVTPSASPSDAADQGGGS